MNKEILSVKPKILHLQEANDIYMELTMCVLTNETNLNKLKFTDDYISGIVDNKDRYIGIPLVANRDKLENGLYYNLTHELDKKTGILKTDSIGSFVDFWSETDDDGVLKLMGLVRVYKRYPNVCNAMIELFESEDLEFSCEIYAYGYADINTETNERSVNYEYEGSINSLFGSCIVTNPAEPKSKANLLVAEALEKDLGGGENVSEVLVFNKGVEISYYGNIEISALTSSDISNQIYNVLNPVDPKSNYRKYNYWINAVYFAKTDNFDGYVIVEDWEDCSTLFRINFSIESDMVVLDAKENWIEGYKGFIPKGINVDDLISQQNAAEIEINNIKNELNTKHEEALQVTEEQIKELQSQLETLQNQVSELNGIVVSQKEEIVQLQNKETELNGVIEGLQPFKEQVETAEKQAKKDGMTEKFSKLLSAETMKSEQVVNAIEALDEVAMNAIVVSEVAKEIASKSTQEVPAKTDVVVSARQSEDLLPQDLRSKLYASKQ
ncbi:hypothetical protein [Paenibacillus cremeus]|uniref:Uncharacterized protein n=1 Tax=Paenibacillus cremeus TaxID=2163881 RepID=A0A559KCV4_9BACL|nr:hypothetical protein [Paenibacillus cremeus]TVY09962.1 hypothetical protein FPZ49_11365 [Paenibacillus cremeus]